MGDRLLILVWHNVEGTWHYPVRPNEGVRGLRHQLSYLKQLATVVPLPDAMDALQAGRPIPPRAVALTFDDGYRDNLELAVPLLEELHLPATFFLVPGLLSGDVWAWWEVLGWGFARSTQTAVRWEGRMLPTRGPAGRSSLLQVSKRLKSRDRAARDRAVAALIQLLQPEGQPPDRSLFLDWDGAHELIRRGFSIGSHSMNHAILSQETAEEQLRDLTASRYRLEAELGVPMELLAYPNGTRADYNMDTILAARQAGHVHAFAAHAGINSWTTPSYTAHRFVMEPQLGFSRILAQRVMSKLAPLGRISSRSNFSTGLERSGPDEPKSNWGAFLGPTESTLSIRLGMVDLQSIEQEWSELALRTRNIRATWEWASVWWRHFGAGQRTLIMAGRTPDERLLTILPFYLRSASQLRILRFIGHGPGDQLGPIYAREDQSLVAHAVVQALANTRWDIFVGERLPASAAWSSVLRAKVIAREGRAVLRAPDGWNAFLARQSSGFRDSVEALERSLVGNHEVTFRLVEDHRDLPAALDTLSHLHAQRCPGVASALQLQAGFHRDFAMIALDRGWLRLWFLDVDGEPVAASYGFRFAGAESCYRAGGDPAWDCRSVQPLLLAHSIRSAFEDGIEEYRFLRGYAPFNHEFTNESSELETIVLARGVVGRGVLSSARRRFAYKNGSGPGRW